MTQTDGLHILTGAPGTGKTTLLSRLAGEIRVVEEPARAVIAEERAVSGRAIYADDPAGFVDRLLQRSIGDHVEARRAGGVALFDRGIPDCVAYAVVMGVDPAPSRREADRYRYDDHVLVMPPWEEIYTTDEDRLMSFADVVGFHEALVDAYRAASYTVVEVPTVPLEERVEFVRSFLRSRQPATDAVRR